MAKEGGRSRNLRPARSDDLGLRRALPDGLLPLLVAAMTFLAGLTLAGVMAAAGLADHWRGGAAATLTVQVPEPRSPAPGLTAPGLTAPGLTAPGLSAPNLSAKSPAPAGVLAGTRIDRAAAMLRATPGVQSVRVLPDAELADLLRPWLGDAATTALPLPGVIEVRLLPGAAGPDTAAAARLQAAAPGAVMEDHGAWLQRLSLLARSLQALAAVALLLVAGVAAAVVAVATRAALAARRDAIEIVHGMGATDGFIAARFANRALASSALGAACGAAAVLPVLLGLARLAAPFRSDAASGWIADLPLSLWLLLPALPAVAAAIGWVTAQGTVRRWLRRLP